MTDLEIMQITINSVVVAIVATGVVVVVFIVVVVVAEQSQTFVRQTNNGQCC